MNFSIWYQHLGKKRFPLQSFRLEYLKKKNKFSPSGILVVVLGNRGIQLYNPMAAIFKL